MVYRSHHYGSAAVGNSLASKRVWQQRRRARNCVSSIDEINSSQSSNGGPISGSSYETPNIQSRCRRHFAVNITGVIQPFGSNMRAVIENTVRLVQAFGTSKSTWNVKVSVKGWYFMPNTANPLEPSTSSNR